MARKKDYRIAPCPNCGKSTRQEIRWILRPEGGKSDLTWYCTSCFTPFEVLISGSQAPKPFKRTQFPSGIIGHICDSRGNRRPVMRDRRGRVVVHQWHGIVG